MRSRAHFFLRLVDEKFIPLLLPAVILCDEEIINFIEMTMLIGKVTRVRC